MSDRDDPDAADTGVTGAAESIPERASVRVRGIYATALTARLGDAGNEVVQASPPIQRRFDGAFPEAEYDARIETTDDRQGVGISGTPDGVAAARDVVAATGTDTFTWSDPTPLGAVFEAAVTADRGSGAVVALGDGEHEGYLPYDVADEYVAEGDALRVQVHEPAPPWRDSRPVVGTEMRVEGGLATLVRDADTRVIDTPSGASREEFLRLAETLGDPAPEGWGVCWERAAADTGLDALGDALDSAAERAADLDVALGADSDGGTGAVGGGDERERGDATAAAGALVAPASTAWAWFGRESRFALDDARATVAPTMAGHHRTKAAAERASVAVDFAERLGAASESFPFAAVVEQFGPGEGDRVAVRHGKPDGRRFTLGRGTVVERDLDARTVTVRREITSAGQYDGLGVERAPGDTATTTFAEGRWWAPTTYRTEEGDLRGTYVNISTPVEVFPSAVRYVDLHVDVLRHADGTVAVVDEDELAAAEDAGHVSPDLAERARDVAERVARGIS